MNSILCLFVLVISLSTSAIYADNTGVINRNQLPQQESEKNNILNPRAILISNFRENQNFNIENIHDVDFSSVRWIFIYTRR